MLALQLYIKVRKIYYKQQHVHYLHIQDSSDYLPTGEGVQGGNISHEINMDVRWYICADVLY